jgi:hypothetical protein
MIDSFVLFAPILLLPVAALLAFAGCELVFPLTVEATTLVPKFRINCGGPAVPDADLAWEADLDPQPAGSAKVNTGNPVVDANGQLANEIYNTCRQGAGGPDSVFSYSRSVGAGDVEVHLKYAWFFTKTNDFKPFSIQISGDGTNSATDNDFNRNFPNFNFGSPARVAFDPPPIGLKVNEGGILTVSFRRALDANDNPLSNDPYVNAIEISKFEIV